MDLQVRSVEVITTVLQKNGIEGLVLSNGMYNAHSTREYTTVDDLYKGAELIGQLILL